MKWSIALVALLVAGCGIQPTENGDPGSTPDFAKGRGGAGHLTVYGQNVYIGADVDAVIAALGNGDPTDDFPSLLAAIQVLGETDFTVRAAAFAAHIDRTRPHAVGLNEISKIDVDLSPFGGPVVHEDFLPELLAALQARGLNYQVAGQVQNIVASPFPGITIIDWDAVLVDADRVTVEPGVVARNFTLNVGVLAPGIDIKRGWVAVPITVAGKRYVVVATHPESGSEPGVDLLRAAQVGELAASLTEQVPTILLGDFNDAPGSPMYQTLTGAGFVDFWGEKRSHLDGLTCCRAGDLSVSPQSLLTKRYDYVFVRRLGGSSDLVNGTIDLFGDRRPDIVQGPVRPIWPSDHAGLVAKLVLPPAAK